MHRHLKPHQWALAFGDPNDRNGVQLYGCPRCAAARGDLEAWILSVAECPRCWPAFEAYEPVPPDALDCETCVAAYQEFEGWLERLEHFEPLVALEWMEADDLVTGLGARPFDAQVTRAESDPAFPRWGTCQRLLEDSKELWSCDPHRAHQLARLAVVAADRLPDDQYHPRWAADLRAKAHAYLANTARITGDLVTSEQEFSCAERWVERGVGQGRAEMTVLDLKASLLLDQNRLLEAEALLERVERHLVENGQDDKVARILIKRAIVSFQRELPRQAAERIDRALERLDPKTQPFLYEVALHNRVEYLLDCGRMAEARSSFENLTEPANRMVRFRRTWLEANLLRTEGDLEAASRLYDDLRIAYLAEDLHLNVAVVSLDLAIVARMQGDHETVRELARDALVLLTRAGAPQEAFAAIRLLVDAVEHEAVSTAFIRQVARNLARVRPPK